MPNTSPRLALLDPEDVARGQVLDHLLEERPAVDGLQAVEDEEQAWARARVSEGDKGGGAARACLEVLSIRSRLLGGGK